MDTLLQFEQTLSDQQVTEQINALMKQALKPDSPGSWEPAVQQLEDLLHRYPNCTTLKYNAAACYDALMMFFPALEDAVRQKWRLRQRTLLEEVRASGSAAYWQSATLGLASDEIAYGDPEKGSVLLKELPEQIGDPTIVWALYYLKKEQPQEALKITQKRLYKLVSQTQSCLTTMMNPRLTPSPQQQLKLAGILHTMAQAFGLPDMSGGLEMEAWLRLDNPEQAAVCLANYVEVLTGPAFFADAALFSPGLDLLQEENQLSSTREMRRLLLQNLEQEYSDSPLARQPLFVQSMEKLRASLSA